MLGWFSEFPEEHMSYPIDTETDSNMVNKVKTAPWKGLYTKCVFQIILTSFIQKSHNNKIFGIIGIADSLYNI